MAIYAQDLSKFELEDVAAAIEAIGLSERGDGELGLPEVGRIIKAIRKFRNDQAKNVDFDKLNAQIKHFHEHPEEYESTAEQKEMADRINKRFGFEQPKEIVIAEPVIMTCPHCLQELPVAPNIRFWSPEELRKHADVLDDIQRQAAANRAASMQEGQ